MLHYKYTRSRPHAVSKAGDVTYQYDANGNMTASSKGRTVNWTTFNKPSSLTQSAQTAEEKNRKLVFDYNTSHQRIRMQSIEDTAVADLSTVTTTTWSLNAGYQQIERPGGIVEHHHSLAVPGASIMVIRHDNADGTVKGESTLYQHHDNLGSANVITGLSAAGKSVIIERQHYGAFGEPLKANSLEGSQSNSDTSPTGYTGHEMLNGFGLVHMNARLFDPVLGRFLSPDTFVQTMSNPQALNRYSYVLNNPVNYTDPTGHFFSSLLATWALYESYHWVKDHPEEARMIAVTAIAVSVTGGMGMAAWQSGMITGAVAGGYGAQQAGGSMGDIAIAAFVGGVQIGHGAYGSQ